MVRMPNGLLPRSVFRYAYVAVSAALLCLSISAGAQACAGPNCLDQQQIACPGGGTTTITGTVFAPNGTDPLPNIMVFVPNAPVAAFTPGVACELPGTLPSGQPLIGTSTNYKGQYVLANAPVGTNIPIVIQSGRWRRQVTIPVVNGCQSNTVNINMPKNKGEGDIPKIALTTGSADALECVLRKIGIDNAEVTASTGTGRINLFTGSGAAGATAGPGTKTQTQLMSDATTLSSYDVLMFACQGGEWLPTGDNSASANLQRANLLDYANKGGRVFGTHYEYGWFSTGAFAGTAQWRNSSTSLNDQSGTINTTFPNGKTLAQWLQYIGASTTYGMMPLSQVRKDTNGVNAPTQEWMHIGDGTPMQFTFNTPLTAAAGQQCGRVLYNDYHVESAGSGTYPAECPATSMTPQEKLLEFSLFNLSGSGAEPTLSPETADFGRSAVNVTTAYQSFTWTNNTIFPIGLQIGVDPDFVYQASCGVVAPGGTCTIQVAFKPTQLGKRNGTLTVTYGGNTSTAALTGTGVPDLESTLATIDFGKLDVTATSATRRITVTNNTPTDIAVASVDVTGDYLRTTTCVTAIPANGTCTIDVAFHPGTTGTRAGTIALTPTDVRHGLIQGALTGIGVDFGLQINPTKGDVIAGYATETGVVLLPIAGFSAPVTVTCTTNAPASTCTPTIVNTVLSANTNFKISISTTSKYTVVGYGGFGGSVWMVLCSVFAGFIVFVTRRRVRGGVRLAVLVVAGLLATGATTGCAGKLPELNGAYTAPGDYTYTVIATDGFLTRNATFTLHVTAAK